ncbi:MAG: hypothetical protein JNK30_19795 [Phenylobacterium sp.]|uniref:hypothetical protein n=1 Tax=Phenylobacterium sp. TaxID=1871053 RepID=UPI001A54E747|nr:hypothetical protein [Phenylobacterium sp.]MBL8773639.1 hypothetical protein [Phenylobacterium sp.]
MRALLLAGFVLTLGTSPAIAKDWKLTLIPADGQEVTFEDGRPFVRSDKAPRSGVALIVATERFAEKQTPTLVVIAKNYLDQPVNFTLANVTVSVDAEPNVAVLTVDDIQAQARTAEKKARQAAMWQAIAVGLQAGAANMQQTSTYQSRTFTPYGSTSTFGTITTPANPYASSAIVANGQNQIAATLENGRRQADAILASADDRGFRPATIAPQGSEASPLTLTRLPKKATTLKIDVALNGETHSFTFGLSQVK